MAAKLMLVIIDDSDEDSTHPEIWASREIDPNDPGGAIAQIAELAAEMLAVETEYRDQDQTEPEPEPEPGKRTIGPDYDTRWEEGRE
jgi:hypothetical protein